MIILKMLLVNECVLPRPKTGKLDLLLNSEIAGVRFGERVHAPSWGIPIPRLGGLVFFIWDIRLDGGSLNDLRTGFVE